MKDITHNHHILPKHMGGTDDPSNLIELSVEDHAEAHKKLWEEHACWQDLLAWKGLSGLLTHEEVTLELFRISGMKSLLSRPTNKGKKYKWKDGYKPIASTRGLLWYHNPKDVTQKCCIKSSETPPETWIRGQGKKGKNPGINFHKKRLTGTTNGVINSPIDVDIVRDSRA